MSNSTKFNLKSFLYAFNGLKEVFLTQSNFKFHMMSTLLATASGFYFKIDRMEWALLLFAIGIVTAAECFNTALEYLTNLVSPQQNIIAGKVKDLAAAGVLVCSVIAFAIGMLIFLPKIFSIC